MMRYYSVKNEKCEQLRRIAIAFICDENFVMPTCVAIASLVRSKKEYTHYVIYVVTTGLKPDDLERIKLLTDEHVEIVIRQAAINKYSMFEKTIRQTMSNVSTAALLKFDLPSIVKEENKLLYLDGDILVKQDLSDLFMTDINGFYVGAVLDSSTLYTKRNLPIECPKYFNSGVMLLNLQKMREDGITDKLIQTKAKLADVSLMDQNVLNIVMVNHVKTLPFFYNFMYTNLARAKNRFTMAQLNEMFDTNYETLTEMNNNAAILHFASKDKPWKNGYVHGQDAWFQIYNSTPYRSVFGCDSNVIPTVSIIITDTSRSTVGHLMQTLKSIAMQQYIQYEVVLVSSVVSQDILDSLLGKTHIVLAQPARNHKNYCFRQGVEMARGKYILWLECGNTLISGSLEKINEILHSSSDPDVIFYKIKADNQSGLGDYVNLIEKGTCVEKGVYDRDNIWITMGRNNNCFPVLWNAITNRNTYCQLLKLINDRDYERAGFDLISVCLRNIIAVNSISTQIDLLEYHFNNNMDVRNLIFDYKWYNEVLDVLSYKNLFASICPVKIYDQALEFIQYILVKYWVKQVSENYAASIFDLMLDKIGISVIGILAARFNNDTYLIAKKLSSCRFIKRDTKKDIKSIGLFFHNIYNGGIQRVVIQLAKIFLENGYKVVIFTDDPPVEGEYPLPSGVVRHELPDRRVCSVKTYDMRADDLTNALNNYQIDLFIYNAWLSKTLLWDTLVAKNAGVKVVTIAHNISALLFAEYKQPANMAMIYQLIDGVITLSRVEEEFFSQYTFARYIPNPCSFDDPEGIIVSPLKGNNILWLARMDQRKNPDHLMNAFLQILDRVPDATVTFVGGGDDKLIDKISRMAQWYGLEDRVEFIGFTLDVERYYKNAAVFVMTSFHEGYPMTLVESKIYGVPAVVYDMPYVEMLRERMGMTIVERGNITELSNAIIDLLINREKLKQMGREARASIEPVSDAYIMHCWQQVFEQIQKEHPPIDLTKRILLENIMEYHEKGVNRYVEKTKKQAEEQKDKLRRELNSVQNSVSFRIGRSITWLPRKVRGGAQCYRDHGTGYTVRRTLYHMGLWEDEEAPKSPENRPKLISGAERFIKGKREKKKG